MNAPRHNQDTLFPFDLQPWTVDALCRQTDPEVFFPEAGGRVEPAKRVCRSCEVRTQCLDYAMAHHERFGVWGGRSERERRRLEQRAAA